MHIRVEPSVKAKAEETLKELGLSITDAINVFLNQVILHDGIPFEIKKPKYNKETLKVLDETKTNKNISKTFDSVDKMVKELDK